MRKIINMIVIAIFLITIINIDSFFTTEIKVFAESNEESIETHDINLYIFGEGGGSQTFPHFHGNITTKEPESKIDEYQELYPKTAGTPGGNDIFWWHSNPLHSNITIYGDVQITIWAVCNSQRNVSFSLIFGINTPVEGGHGYGNVTEGKMVSSEPVEFNSIISKETLEENELINFSTGDSITFGIQAYYQQPQLPAEVRVLYNSSTHPSHMRINTNSISVNILDSTNSEYTAIVDLEIIDAFGIEDIKEYEIQIFNPKDNEIDVVIISESLFPQEGKIDLDLIWSDSNSISGEYTIVTTVTDNNNNQWELINKFDYQYPGEETDDTTSEDNSLLFLLLFVGIIILFTILGFIIARRKRKDE
jgi:hypothetical protein